MSLEELAFDEETKRVDLAKDVEGGPFGYKAKTSIFATRSFSGYATADVSSAMQKAIRRGFSGDAAYWAVQGHQTGTVAGGHPLRSNLWNRLVVISVEDVGPADLRVQSTVLDLMESARDDPRAIATAAALLARAHKSRVTDNLLHLFSFSKEWAQRLMQRLGGVEKVVQMAIHRAQKGMIKKLSVLLRVLGAAGGKEKLKVGRRLALSLIAEEVVKGSPVGERLRRHMGSKGETYLLIVLMSILNASGLRFERREELPELLELDFDWKARRGVPEYALDVHSSQKRKFRDEREGALHFWEVGAVLGNAHPQLKSVDEEMVEMVTRKIRDELWDFLSWEWGMTFNDQRIREALSAGGRES